MEIAGIQLHDSASEYSNWVGTEKLRNDNTLEISARPSNGKQYRHIENKDVEQMLYDIEFRDIDYDYALSSTSRIDLALNELNKKKAEWVIGIIRKLQLPNKIEAELAKTDWVISRLSEPYPLDMHNQDMDEEYLT